MQETIKASEKALGKVFCDDFRFSIPGYQRPYSWTPEEAGALFDDLLNAMEEDDPSEASPYFMGSIVLIKDPDSQKADVVDGQQRLTTLTILISVLRDRMEGEEKQDAHSYVVQKGKKFAGVPDSDRLKLGHRDAEFFKGKIQTEDATMSLPSVDDDDPELSDSRKNILKNAHWLAERVEGMDSDKRLNLLSFMIQRCFLVVVEASDRNAAYRIFSVLNARGLDLSLTDILKAEILRDIAESKPETSTTHYTTLWEDIEDSLGRDRFGDLFARILMIEKPEKPRRALDVEFRNHVLKEMPDKTVFMEDTLKPRSEAYLQILKQGFTGEQSESINKSLQHLAMLDYSEWEPPTILFLSKFDQYRDLVKRFLSAIDALAYAIFIRGDYVRKKINRYAKVIDIIKQTDSGDAVLANDSPLSLYLSSDEKEEMVEGLGGPVYENKRICKTILLRLDEASSEDGATYKRKIISIEHVLPQKPAEGSEWMTLFNEEERGYWTHRLANLVLLSKSKNSQAQNYSFERKKNEYFGSKNRTTENGTSTFALTTQVLHTDSWTPDHLAARQENLLETCRKIWNLHT